MKKQFDSYEEAYEYYADCLLAYNESYGWLTQGGWFNREMHDLIRLEDLRCIWTDEIVTIGELNYLE